MKYVKYFDMLGVDTAQIPCIELHGVPNAATVGAVGLLGMDVDSEGHELYKCVKVEGNIYTWEQVTRGRDGIYIMSAYIDINGDLILTFSDGNTINAGVVKGEKGERGPQGEKGENGDSWVNTLYKHKISLYDTDEREQQVGNLFIVTNSAKPFEIRLNDGGNYEIRMGANSIVISVRWSDIYTNRTYSLLLNTGANDLVLDLMNVVYADEYGTWRTVDLCDRLNENSTDVVEALPSVAMTTTLNTEV